MEAFCFKCRGKHTLLNPKPIFFANGAPATQGTCSNCGNEKVFKMGRTPEHEGMTPPEPVKREPRPKAERRTSAGRSSASARTVSRTDGVTSSGRPLVIVESPAKARTIGKFLGARYSVKASIGHIRDLPKSRLGVDLDNDFAPTYISPMNKKATVKELRQLARSAKSIWLATDPDREGEAISWHLTHALADEIEGKPVHRVEFHEITHDAIDRAFSHPRQIDENAVNAQQARRILDRLVGYKLSPLLSDKMSRRGLSAGRVQSVALRLVVEREREIQAFVPVEYWSIEAELSKILDSGAHLSDSPGGHGNPGSRIQDQTFIARLHKLRGQDPDLKNETDAARIVDALEGASYSVVKVERKDRSRRPAAPFTTSTLQQEASRKLGFNARRAMATAQQLYEGIDVGEGTVGLITYMRTDSVNVAESAQQEARQFIAERYGAEFMPGTRPVYTSRARNAQEAHEAIRPTSVFRTPEALKGFLDRDQFRLYDLIWKRFVASQMANAIFDATTVDIDARPRTDDGGLQADGGAVASDGAINPPPSLYKPLARYWFRATGSVIKFAGFLKVYEEGHDEGDKLDEDDEARGRRLPDLVPGEPLELIRLIPEQHFTQPPPRYTEASLVKALEEFGIGRPSTYASIMGTIQVRDYVRREGKQLVPTPLGFDANDLLVGNFARYVDVGFTAHVEEELDDIETGTREWQPVLHEFYDPFREAVEQAAATIPKMEREVIYTGESCPDCADGRLVLRDGRFGKFIACSNFPRCKHTEPITLPGVRCPKCGGKLVEKRARKGQRRIFYGCVNYPDCDFTTWNKPLPIQGPDGCEGLVVDLGKGKAKCLGNDLVFDLPEQLPEPVAP
jgi:DNA topoisomerase-1